MRHGPGRFWKSTACSLAAMVLVLLATACGGGGSSAKAAPPTYTVTSSGNGSTGGTVPVDSGAYGQGATVTVLGNTGSLVMTGSSFGGWNSAAAGTGTAYAQGQTFTMGTANVTLYAQWTANPVVAGFAYAVNQYDYTVSQLTMASTGLLTVDATPSVPCQADPNRLAVDPSGKYVYVTNLKGGASNTGGSISQYGIQADGTLAPLNPAVIAQGGGSTDILVHPTGKWAYAVSSKNPGAAVVQYTIGADGTLTQASSALTSYVFPNFLTIDPSGRFLYVTIQNGSIDQFTIDPTTGALTAMTPASVNFTGAGSTTFAVTVHPSGKWAYVTDYYGAIAEYAIDPATGALSPLADTTVDGAVQFAAWITVDPSGKYAYVANAGTTTNAISQYTVGADGKLTAMTPASVAATSPGTCVQVDSTGSWLYMTSGNGAGATDVISQYALGASGGLTPMNPATVTVGFGPNAIVLVHK